MEIEFEKEEEEELEKESEIEFEREEAEELEFFFWNGSFIMQWVTWNWGIEGICLSIMCLLLFSIQFSSIKSSQY